MAEEKPVVEETVEDKPATDETIVEDKKAEPEDQNVEKEDGSDKKEEKIDPNVERKKNNQDRAWERVIEKNARMAAELDQIKQTLAQQQAQKTQQDAPTAPKREDFTEIGDYLEAKQDYNNLVLRQQLAQEIAQIKRAPQSEPEITDWDEAEEKARAKYSDYDDVIDKAQDVMVPDDGVAIEAIRRSPVGPDLMYHLVKNPEDVKKLNRIKVAGDQIFFLGQLAGRLTEAKTKIPKASAAPKPITPEKSGGGGVEINRDKLSDKEWFALRDKERKAKFAGKT